MRRPCDVFEKFPDGSTLWRACVNGRYEAQRKMYELAEHSENEFFLIDIQAEVLLPPSLPRRNSRPLIESAVVGNCGGCLEKIENLSSR
jgi:hypothetical protein